MKVTDGMVAAAERELWMGGMRDVSDGVVRAAIEAALAAAPQGEPVAWQYQWLNPGGGPVHDGCDDWFLLKPRDVGQSQQQCIDDMLAYRMHGQPVYAVRPLYAGQLIKGD